jgi:hypothetical protein
MDDNSKGAIQTVLNFLIILLLVILLLVSAYAGYRVYYNIPQSPQNLGVVINQDINQGNSSFLEVKQFNKNMKFNHNNISYQLFECDAGKKQRMLKSFEILSNEVPEIIFYETYENPDIEIVCSEKNLPADNKESDYFIAGEGGAKEIIKTEKYNIITNGSVLLYKPLRGISKCETPEVELHELIHVFGFEHSSNENSLMYPYLTSCEQKLDTSIINELRRLYSEKNLPDLYFETFNFPVKKGRYLDLNFTIKNSGTIEAKNVSFSIIEDGIELENNQLGDINPGAGVFMKIEYLKLNSMNPKEIQVVIDKNNKIQEFDKVNNLAEIKIENSD